jgi:hypothetical protein
MVTNMKHKDRNSIYDYYRKVEDRFYKALPTLKNTVKFIWEPLARKASIAGFEDYDFFVLGERGNFQLREALSGTIILQQESTETREMREGSLKTFQGYLPAEINLRGGRAFLNCRIINAIVDQNYQISPRYKLRNEKNPHTK